MRGSAIAARGLPRAGTRVPRGPMVLIASLYDDRRSRVAASAPLMRMPASLYPRYQTELHKAAANSLGSRPQTTIRPAREQQQLREDEDIHHRLQPEFEAHVLA